jgi:hypothetical protein
MDKAISHLDAQCGRGLKIRFVLVILNEGADAASLSSTFILKDLKEVINSIT